MLNACAYANKQTNLTPFYVRSVISPWGALRRCYQRLGMAPSSHAQKKKAFPNPCAKLFFWVPPLHHFYCFHNSTIPHRFQECAEGDSI